MAATDHIRVTGIRVHRFLAWCAGIALVIWGVSGLLHPLMVFTGPEAAKFFPPTAPLDLDGKKPLGSILAQAGVTEAVSVKVVAGPDGHVLQVTENEEAPRRYFDLDTGTEFPGHDREQAVFLARYYSGLQDTPIADVTFQTGFDAQYPWVNRLLPVYRVTFDTPDRLTVYAYTETNALAFLTNDYKRSLATAFQVMHTLSWVPQSLEWPRVGAVAILVGSLVGMSISGLIMLLLIKRRRPALGIRGWHRIPAYVLGVPIMFLAFSGVYHLIFMANHTPQKNLKLSPSIDLREVNFSITEEWRDVTAGLNVTSLAIVESAAGEGLFRLGLARPRSGQGPSSPRERRNARFDGLPRTGPALYLSTMDGQAWPAGDQELALQMAERFTGRPRDEIEDVSLVTRFGAKYDFRNKRLPVWQVRYGPPLNELYFIDTKGGVLADRRTLAGEWEQLSFSILHKWNFLRAFGRDIPNYALTVIVGLSVLLMGILGLWLQAKRSFRNRMN